MSRENAGPGSPASMYIRLRRLARDTLISGSMSKPHPTLAARRLATELTAALTTGIGCAAQAPHCGIISESVRVTTVKDIGNA